MISRFQRNVKGASQTQLLVSFVELMSFIDAAYKVPSQTNTSAVVCQQYDQLQSELVTLLNASNGIAVTTDLWSSSTNIAHGMYTGHYFN